MNADERRHIRGIVRKVHPDLFSAHPLQRQQNSESLKVLNNYVQALSKGGTVSAATLTFHVKDGPDLQTITAKLPTSGSLGPLFYAFGLIDEAELRAGAGSRPSSSDTNFLSWLQDTVHDAIKTAEQHEVLKLRIREMRASLESKFGLASLQVGSEFVAGLAEQQRQLEALGVLEACLSSLTRKQGYTFEGLTIQLYHPDSTPLGTYSGVDAFGDINLAPAPMSSYVAEDGCLHVVADRANITSSIAALDLDKAQVLTRVTLYWTKRVKELTPVVKAVLGVENIWCDMRSEQSSQRFVLWAGYILEHRKKFDEVLNQRQFSFSVLVHSDTTSPLLDFTATSSAVLQVRSDCPPKKLLDFLCSDTGSAANAAAAAIETSRVEEEELLEKVRGALGAKHVIRVCSAHEQDKVLEGAHKLLQHADQIMQVVDLRGASIAIDDCYEVWESGFISIPYDFEITELSQQVRKLLLAGSNKGAAAAAGAGAGGAAAAAAASSRAAAAGSNGAGAGAASMSDLPDLPDLPPNVTVSGFADAAAAARSSRTGSNTPSTSSSSKKGSGSGRVMQTAALPAGMRPLGQLAQHAHLAAASHPAGRWRSEVFAPAHHQHLHHQHHHGTGAGHRRCSMRGVLL